MNLEDIKKYDRLRTNLLYDFTHSPLFNISSEEISFFLNAWEQLHCVFMSYLAVLAERNNNYGLFRCEYHLSEDTLALYNNTITPKGNEPWISYCIEGINPLSAREFFYLEKGKYYLGYDLDEDLIGLIPYLKDQELFEKYNEELKKYFKFRYDTYDLSLLGEYTAVPFNIHETRLLQYKKTGKLEFDLPKEIFKYPVNEWFKQMYISQSHKGTRLINIRGTNGSGKSTLVNSLYLSSENKETVSVTLSNRRGQSHPRFFDVLYDKHVILLGGYNSEYGTKGVDRMDDVTEIVQGIMYVINNYPGWTIVMESATVSTSFWSYAVLFDLLQKQGVTVNIVHLLMKDWNFCINNVRNRTKRKEGAKEPKWEEIKDKRFILYKNHFRFNSILGHSYIEYPDTYSLENLPMLMEKILCIK